MLILGEQARYEDSIGWKDIAIPAIKLDEEGVWDVRVIYDSEEKHDLLTNYKSGDSDIIIPGRIEVEPRVSISILDTNKQILKDSDESSRTSIKIAIESTILAFIVGFAGILSTIFLTKNNWIRWIYFICDKLRSKIKLRRINNTEFLMG